MTPAPAAAFWSLFVAVVLIGVMVFHHVFWGHR